MFFCFTTPAFGKQMYFLVNLHNVFNFNVFVTDTKSIKYKHSQSAQCRLIKTVTTERLIASLEEEQQGYRHFLNTIVR